MIKQLLKTARRINGFDFLRLSIILVAMELILNMFALSHDLWFFIEYACLILTYIVFLSLIHI